MNNYLVLVIAALCIQRTLEALLTIKITRESRLERLNGNWEAWNQALVSESNRFREVQ